MTRTPPARVWLITGAGRGLGLAFVGAALSAGDQVVATARHTSAELAALVDSHPGNLVVFPLDVTDRDAVFATVDKAVAAFGRLDVVVNNAGYGLMGAVEEVSEAEARAQLDTNFFGALWVTQAVLPQLRAQGSGHIVQISSVGGIGTCPTLALYNASKWALEGFSDALAREVAGFGIRVTIAQPGGFATDWAGSSMRFAPSTETYDPLRADLFGADFRPGQPESTTEAGTEPQAAPAADAEAVAADEATEGDPADAAQALLTLVNSDDPPLRQLIGADAFDQARIALEWRRDDYRRDPRFVWPS